MANYLKLVGDPGSFEERPTFAGVYQIDVHGKQRIYSATTLDLTTNITDTDIFYVDITKLGVFGGPLIAVYTRGDGTAALIFDLDYGKNLLHLVYISEPNYIGGFVAGNLVVLNPFTSGGEFHVTINRTLLPVGNQNADTNAIASILDAMEWAGNADIVDFDKWSEREGSRWKLDPAFISAINSQIEQS